MAGRAQDMGSAPVAMAPAFEEAVTGARGWGLTRADVAFSVATAVAALAICLVLWFGYGVEGVPGWGGGPEEPADTPAASDVPGATWTPGAPSVDGGATGGSAASAAEGLMAVIQNTDGFYQVLPLDTDTEVTVVSEFGTNTFEVRDGRIRCRESDCSNQVCTGTGWVSSSGQMIVCLPHELTVQVTRDPSEAAPLV